MSDLPPDPAPDPARVNAAGPRDRPCPACAEPVPTDSNFCEACGAVVGDGVGDKVPGSPVTAPPPGVEHEAAPIEAGTSAVTPARRGGSAAASGGRHTGARPCLQCGGAVGDDGWCQTCGAKAPSERDHFRADPAPWVAAVSDRGIAHHRNEDAMAVHASGDGTAPERRAVLVVLDGVSRTDDSSAGSLAGSTAALAVLAAPSPRGLGTDAGREAVLTHLLTEAVRVANDEVVAATTPGTDRPASATFTAVVLEGDTAWHANIGDSRSYWLPDDGEGVQLTVDDSAAQMQIAAGVPRLEAEASAQAHAITGWLGADSPSLVPTVGHRTLTGPGWLLACSDGLWNYASTPTELAAQVAAAGSVVPAEVALHLVGFANGRGGQDNITVALARLDTPTTEAGPTPPTPPTAQAPQAPQAAQASQTTQTVQTPETGAADG